MVNDVPSYASIFSDSDAICLSPLSLSLLNVACLVIPRPFCAQHNLRLKAGRKQLAAKLAKIKAGGEGGVGDSGEYGISWGFDEDAVDEDDEADEADGADGADGEVRVIVPRVLLCESRKGVQTAGRWSER